MHIQISRLFHAIRTVVFFASILGFLFWGNTNTMASYPSYVQQGDPIFGWHTFQGAGVGTYSPSANGIVVDVSGNVYVTGRSREWGNPIRAYSGDWDVYVAKLNSEGVVVWTTFLGDDLSDSAGNIAVDGDSNVYVVGTSNGSWGNPINPFNGLSESFVAKLNANGVLQWNTFMGGYNQADDGWGLALDSVGNIYVVGNSQTGWGNPINAHAGEYDCFVAKINNSGERLWNTFLGSTDQDFGLNIAIDNSDNLYPIGVSELTWGNPLSPHNGNEDAFLAKLNSDGGLEWNAFLGSTKNDNVWDIDLDNNGNIYLIGMSLETWGEPFISFSGLNDPFVAKISSSGETLWNTFLGSTYSSSSTVPPLEEGKGLTVGNDENIYITGASRGTWGNPAEPFHGTSGTEDAYAAKLNSSGDLLWNTFIGTSDYDNGEGIAIGVDGVFYVFGEANDPWGDPINNFAGTIGDNFIVQFKPSETRLFLPLVVKLH